MKAERGVGTQLFGQAKKEPAVAKAGDGGAKIPASKAAPKKAAAKPAPAPKKKVLHVYIWYVFRPHYNYVSLTNL